MKKFALMLVALLMVGVWPVAALPVNDLTLLAQYLPEETTLFAAIRADDAYLDTLQGLVDQAAAVSALIPDDVDVRAQLNDALGVPEGQQSPLEAWIGDTVAVGVTDLVGLLNPAAGAERDQPFIIAFEVSDDAAAEAFLDTVTDSHDKVDIQDGGTLYAPTDEDFARFVPTFYLEPGVLLARTSGVDPLSIVPAATTLADSDDFGAAMDRLPEDDYNAAVYVGVPAQLIEQAEAIGANLLAGLPFDIDLATLLEAIGPQSIGFTIIDDRSLVMDFAAHVADPAALAAAGITLDNTGAAGLDLSFVENLSSEVALFVSDTNFGPAFLAQLAMVEMLGEAADAQIAAGAGEIDPQAESFFAERARVRQLQATAQADDLVTFFRLAFRGMFGLPLEEALGWMSDDFIVYLTALPGADDTLPVVDFGALVRITDAEAADAFMEGLPNFLRELAISHTAAGDVVTITEVSEVLLDPNYEIVVRDDGDVMAFGNLISYQGDAPRLSESEVYQTASQAFLPDTQTLAFINTAPLVDLSREVAQLGLPQAALVTQLLPVLESASVTASYTEDGASGAVRFVLTLAEAE